LVPLLASSFLSSKVNPSKEGGISNGEQGEDSSSTENSLGQISSEKISKTSSDDYMQLQRRVYLTTVLVSLIGSLITAFLFEQSTSMSFLLGSLAGVAYLRLLARSIGKIGGSSRSLGKIQLIVPILLFFAVSKLSQFDLLPALLGFFLYKPILILHYLLGSKKDLAATQID